MLLTPVNAGHIIVGRPKTVLDLTGAVAAFYDANTESSLRCVILIPDWST
jgi:hypothetical protein